jgi:hypothetical protein
VGHTLQITQKVRQDLAKYEELLGLAGGLKITPAERQSQKVRSDLEGKGLTPEEQIRARYVKSQFTPAMVRMQKVASTFSDYMTSTFESIAAGAEISFAKMASDFGRMVMDLILEATGFKETMAKLFKDALQGSGGEGGTGGIAGFFEKLFRAGAPGGGGGPTPHTNQYSASIGPTMSGEPMAEGGTVAMPGGFYRVGERGEETVHLPGGSRVYPHGQQPGGMVVNVTFNTPDQGSFMRSSGEWQARLLSTIRKSQRNG